MATTPIPKPDLPKALLEKLDGLADAQLRELLPLPEGKGGLRYYLSKGQKIEYLRTRTTQTRRAELLDAARTRQNEHHVYLRTRRQEGSPDRQLQIEERMGNRAWRFDHEERLEEKFKDDVTGRQAMIAYVVVAIDNGETLRLTKGTLQDAYERLGLIQGWPQPKARSAAPEAAKAGLSTAASLGSSLAFLRGKAS